MLFAHNSLRSSFSHSSKIRPTIAAIAFVFCLAAVQNASAATYTVTNTSDGGLGSLRDAITLANATAADDLITFNIANCPGGVCTISLTSSDLGINAISTAGKLTISNTSGAANLIINGNNQSRAFLVKTGADFFLSGVTITNGNGTGTTDPSLDKLGGGIFSDGRLTLTDSIIRNNNSQSGSSSNIPNGGGIFIYSRGTLILTNTTVSGNASQYGAGIRNYFGTATIINSTISNNTGGWNGGIDNVNGTVTITNSIISGNSATTGGGIFNTGMLTITKSTICNNYAEFNSGGIFSNSTLIMTNSTVSGNVASQNYGGGIRAEGTAILTNLTVTNNRAGIYGGGGGIDIDYATLIYIRNTIVANNNATTGPDIHFSGRGNVQSGGNNLIGNANTGNPVTWSAGDILNQPARLAPLGNYGGATPTHPPFANSPAINNGNNCVVNLSCPSHNPPSALTTDQRNLNRQVGSNVDIGAVELQTNEIYRVDGRVVGPDGRGVRNATVSITDSGGSVRTATTSSFGFFSFDNVFGQAYTFRVSSRLFRFSPRTVQVDSNLTLPDFVGLE